MWSFYLFIYFASLTRVKFSFLTSKKKLANQWQNRQTKPTGWSKDLASKRIRWISVSSWLGLGLDSASDLISASSDLGHDNGGLNLSSVSNIQITASDTVHNLGVVLNKHLIVSSHITWVSHAGFSFGSSMQVSPLRHQEDPDISIHESHSGACSVSCHLNSGHLCSSVVSLHCCFPSTGFLYLATFSKI